MSEDMIKIYHLTADYKKCTYQTEQWNNTLSNGKHVRFEITNYFYWGTFEIELTDKEKEEILKKDSIILNDYAGVSVESLDSGCDYSDEICNKDSYTSDELKEIHRLLYLDRYHHTHYTSDCDDDVDIDILELNNWTMDDTIYGIDTGCKLECISGDECPIDMVDCEGCGKSVLRSDTQPFVENNFLCETCIDMNLEEVILYNCCNICNKFYHASDDDNDCDDCDDCYNGDVCYLCLPGITNTREEMKEATTVPDMNVFCNLDKTEEDIPNVDMFCI